MPIGILWIKFYISRPDADGKIVRICALSSEVQESLSSSPFNPHPPLGQRAFSRKDLSMKRVDVVGISEDEFLQLHSRACKGDACFVRAEESPSLDFAALL